MLELIIVESVIGIFLLLHIVRPYIMGFRNAAGCVFFPPIALFCTIAMIPAYGIRPECLPLFLFTAVYTILHFSSIIRVLARLRSYPDYNNAPVRSFIAALLLALSLSAAFRFAPFDDPRSVRKTQFTVTDSVRGVDLFVSYYQSGGDNLVLIIPPVTVPLSTIEGVCVAVQKQGYKVLAFSRPHFDNTAVDQNGKAVELPFFEKLKRYRQAASDVTNQKIATRQRAEVAERNADILFLLSVLGTDPELRKVVPYYEDVFLLGYGAGGSAAVELSGNRNFLRKTPKVKAVAAIESIALCDFSPPPSEPLGKTFRAKFGGILKKIFQIPAPRLENVPQPEIPVLVVAGDGAQGKKSYNRYMAVIQTMLETKAPFLFASINGIHAIDFSSLPHKYPVASLMLRGKKEGDWPRETAVENTARYIATFFSLAGQDPSLQHLRGNLANPQAIYLETSRSQ
jgi:hypothetical protein